MKKMLSIIVACLVIFGCVSHPPETRSILPDQIAQKHFVIYTNTQDRSNMEISAILRYFSEQIRTNKSTKWCELSEKEDAYIRSLYTNSISFYYTIMAKTNSIILSDQFLDDSIDAIRSNGDLPQNVPIIIPDYMKAYIFRINDYEYSRSAER